ncbi:hypothetical protein IW261DRAFT_1422670 [Armillaria novae-zelandiae]|uniref:Uncharacterized protein n=1 Tax=Armillaria novae-zelandiae TaxID=153914 RepID=A0AA39T9V7_9AGAR|nr:hypothetical protein IW261DRAFT_1422670 [Armillaria novae-zelandiae]
MPIKYYYIRAGLQAKDAFFGDIKRIYPRSSSLMDEFPAKVLLKAERRYGNKLARENVDKMSVFSGWHSSSANPRYHYTLRAYNLAGWMAVTIEMEAANQGRVYTYYPGDWSQWMMHTRNVYFILKERLFLFLKVYYGAPLDRLGSSCEVTGLHNRRGSQFWCQGFLLSHFQPLEEDLMDIFYPSPRPQRSPFPRKFWERSKKRVKGMTCRIRYDNLSNGYVINTSAQRVQVTLTLSLPRKDLICHPPNTTIHPYVFKVPASTLLGVLPVMGRHDYACQHDYTAEQREYMSQQGILFERAVQDNHVLIFFTRLFEDWFDQWSITDDRSDAAVEQLKVEISTLYIMGLKNQWVVHGLHPDGWTEEYVIDKLDYLEDMVVILWELRRLLLSVCLDPTSVRRIPAGSNMVYDLRTRKVPSLEIPPPPRLIVRVQPDNPPSQSQMSRSKSSLNARDDEFTPPPAPDAAADLIRCIDDMEVSLGFVKKRAIRHLVTIQGAMMNTWSYPAWKQNNGELVPVSVENLQQYMLEWELEGPNCFCPLVDPSSSLVQTILRQDDVDGQWSFVCASDYCKYRVNLTRIFGPGLPQSALQNHASCDEDAPPIEDLDYRTYEKRWEKKHGKRWHSLETVLSDIEEGVEAETMSAKAPDSVVPESDGEAGPKSPPVPRLDLTTKRRNSENTILTRKYMKVGLTALRLKERRRSPQAQEAGDNSVQPVGEDVAQAPTGFHETTLFRQTIPVPRRRELWIHLTQKAEGVTSEELAGLLVRCGGCTKYYRDGLIHYCV